MRKNISSIFFETYKSGRLIFKIHISCYRQNYLKLSVVKGNDYQSPLGEPLLFSFTDQKKKISF